MTSPKAYEDFGLTLIWRPSKAKRVFDHVGHRGGQLSPPVKARLNRVVSKAPEVVVKISGRTKDANHLKAHLDYVTRNGKIAADTDLGVLKGRTAVADLHADWTVDDRLLARSQSLRKAPLSVNMVLSMPKAVDRERFRDAVTDFVDRELRPRVDVVVCFHHDTAHPHAHVTVRGRDREGRTFNPRKADLHVFREQFAASLRHRGIEAEATPRSARGVGLKGQRAAIRQMEKRDVTPRVLEAAYAQAVREHREGPGERPWEARMDRRHRAVRKVYDAAARSLAASADPLDHKLADRVTAFTKGMAVGLPKTRHAFYSRALTHRDEHQDQDFRNESDPARSDSERS